MLGKIELLIIGGLALKEKTNKTWKTFGTFETYEEAAAQKNKLLEIHELVKVKRFGKGGSTYKVKFWNPDTQKETKRKKKRKAKNI